MTSPESLVAEAEKLLKPKALAKVISPVDSDTYKDAAELYIRAGNLYNSSKQSLLAGKTLECAAQCLKKCLGTEKEVHNILFAAYQQFRWTSKEDAVRVLKEIIDNCIFSDNIENCANFKMSLGRLYLEMNLTDEANAEFEQARDLYGSLNLRVQASSAGSECAKLGALGGNYLQAAAILKGCAKNCGTGGNSKKTFESYVFDSVLCYLAGDDVVAAQRCLQFFVEWDKTFVQTRKYEILQNLIKAYETKDGKMFSSAMFALDRFGEYTEWREKMESVILNSFSIDNDDIL